MQATTSDDSGGDSLSEISRWIYGVTRNASIEPEITQWTKLLTTLTFVLEIRLIL